MDFYFWFFYEFLYLDVLKGYETQQMQCGISFFCYAALSASTTPLVLLIKKGTTTSIETQAEKLHEYLFSSFSHTTPITSSCL